MTFGAEPARVGGQQPDLGAFMRLMAFAAFSLLRRRMGVTGLFTGVGMAFDAESIVLVTKQLFAAVCR